ncbi:MAG: restriction endonuclease [Rhodospirillales bacterium]|jgi:hypothetical protein|nr:restriction endonuclease [Rhodospirillales bacterium]
MTDPLQGSLFSSDFLRDSITRLGDWQAIDDAEVERLEAELRGIFARFPTAQTPNEHQTEDDLIWPVLARLGWTATLRQQNLTPRGREDVPDGLLFADDAAKDRANGFAEEWKRYEFGLAVVESKRWLRPLDRRSGRRGEETAPSTQMLRYLRRVDDLTTGHLRWGILTNGARWRLYYQGARSVSEQFFEIDLAAILDLPGHNEGLFALDDGARRHWLRVFALVFRREAFLPAAADPRTFHQRAIDEARFYEERVAASLSDVVFGTVFPALARAIAAAAPDASLQDVREAALILLYRLLFILYAEDRDLLPVRDARYDDYGLRDKVRGDVGRRKDRDDAFSATAARYWSAVDDLCRAIDQGDAAIGLPPYNGGLFDRKRTPLLADIRLGDQLMADVIDALSFERTAEGRRYINYRDLGVQQLGSIYERLLEHEIVRDGAEIQVRPNVFARKGSGSYYTPEDLVGLILAETVEPLVAQRMAAFTAKAAELVAGRLPEDRRIGTLKTLDPAERLLELKICDPAMGSGHFLVNLVDYLADQVIAAMADAEAAVDDYLSPLSDRIDAIRNTIMANAEARGWTVDPGQLDDRHIIRRMVLKRCVYGVDKNPMAVELAKVALWLHTFTVGAPLSFLDHHLRCGDSLFGSWVRAGIDKATAQGSPLLLHGPLTKATRAATQMQIIEGLTDAEIAEAHRSADVFDEVRDMTAPLDAFLSLVHAFDWLNIRDRADRAALRAFFDGQFGDPIVLAQGQTEVRNGRPEAARFAALFARARALVVEERFLNWQVAFPGVWSEWESAARHGGFDAVIGNPPWDRMKLQQVEWFAARRREIALAQRAADRQRMIAALESDGDPLAQDFTKANERAEAAVRVARDGGDYPLLSGGDVNLYSLFVERAMALVKPQGMVGLLTPSGIASDKTAAPFFKGVATQGRLKALYDFENRRTRFDAPPFFPDVDSRFKFCALVASPSPMAAPAQCAFFLQDVSELDDPERCFPLTPEDFARVNPNTGTAPIFRSRRDAALTTAIYGRLPVLVDRSAGAEVKAWPVKYVRMFDMTNDSGLFRTRRELEEREGAYPTGGNRFGSPTGEWVPLYEGKMVQAFDHRAASVVVNPGNQHRPAQPEPATLEQHANADWLPDPQFWVAASECGWTPELTWVLGFKEITAPTNIRTFIAALFPTVGFGNKVPILKPETPARDEWLLAANFNTTIFDFVTRQKVQGQTLNLFIVEQLPVIPPNRYEAVRFGPKTAGEIVREAVLELTYTARDMAPFARDMGHVDEAGDVKPPFRWDEARRLRLRAKLDAVFFHLYGVADRDDVRYVYSTFPIVERQETAAHGRYLSRDLCLAYMSALAAGDPDAEVGP